MLTRVFHAEQSFCVVTETLTSQLIPTGNELQISLLEEKARASGLDVQVKALCLELAQVREAAGKC